MPKQTLSDKMSQQSFSRNERVIPKSVKNHPAVSQAKKSFTKLHGGRRGK